MEESSPSYSVSQDIERRNEIKDGLTLLDALMRKEVIKSSVKTTCSYPKRHQTLDKDLMRLSPRKVKKKLNGERKSWLKKVLCTSSSSTEDEITPRKFAKVTENGNLVINSSNLS